MQRDAPQLFVKLRVGRDDHRVVSDSVISFRYQDRERKADLCVLEVDNFDLSNFDDPVWRKGGLLVVSWGYPGAMSPAREAVITSVKGFTTLQVEAAARSVELNTVTRSRTFEGRTVSQIASQIAEEAGFSGDRLHVEPTDEVIPVVSQARLTDAQFLRRWAAKLGFEFYVDFDGLHFHPRRLGTRPTRVFRYYTDPGAGDILDASVENDVTAKPGKVKVKGRDPAARADIDVEASNDTDDDRDVLTEHVEIIDLDSGSGTVVERRVAAEDTVSTSDASATQAAQRARARFRRTQQTAVKMALTVVGDPLLLAKTVVQVEGMGRRLSVRYYVEEVEHDLSPKGYTSKLRLVSDGHGGHSTVSPKAAGLSLFEAAPGPGSGKGASEEVLRGLADAAEAARAAGDASRAAELEDLRRTYQRRGNRARAEIDRRLAAIGSDPEASDTARQASGVIRAALAQQGPEVESGGRVNDLEAEEDGGDELTPEERVDLDTGETVTGYRQTPRRG